MAFPQNRAEGTEMKKLTLLLAVAFSCSGLNSTYAQMQLRSGQPTPAPRLVSDQNPFPFADSALEEQISNPFDYFSDQPALEDPVEKGKLTNADQAIPQTHSDPSSLPVARPNRSMVDTLVDHSTLADVPDASMVPIYWGEAPHTPNPVAQWLTREQCVQGLWDGYQAQRAQECIAMQARLAGHGFCGCGPSACSGPCAACAAPPVRNRYREHLGASLGGKKCDDCTSCDATTSSTPCDSSAAAAAVQAGSDASTVQPVSAAEAVAPQNQTQPAASSGKVAYLPAQLIR